MKKVEFLINENDNLQGVKTISLVDAPAIESDFIFFNKEKKQFIELKSDKYKQVVAGLALIPNKYILRFDGLNEPYYGFFSVDTIEKIRTKFHKELLTSMVNTDHSSNYIDAFLIESFIVDTEERLADVKAKGITEATLGCWFVAYKIEDPETFQRVLSGELKGFSVEVFLQQFCKMENNNINNYELSMNKILEKFKTFLSELEGEQKAEEKQLAKGTTTDGKSIEYGAKDEPVNIIAEDGSTSAAPDGEYTIDAKVLTVKGGLLVDIKDAPVAQAKVEEPKVEASKVESTELEKIKAELAQLKTDFEKSKTELAKANDEVTKLKKAPIANPVTKAEVKTEKIDFSKLSNADKFRYQYGIK